MIRITIVVVASLACSAPTSTTEHHPPIIAGDPANDPAMVELQIGNEVCSGTLLLADWVLTAGHCVASWTATSDAITVRTAAGTSVQANDVRIHPGFSPAGTGAHAVDVALVHLQTRLPMPSGWLMPIYQGDTAALVGQTLTCFGWGVSSGGLSASASSGDLALRSAVIPVTATDPYGYVLGPNGGGQIPAGGDSGGACFVEGPAGRFLAGVQSYCTAGYYGNIVSCTQVGAGQFDAWAMTQLYAERAFSDSFAYENSGTRKWLLPSTPQQTSWDPCAGGCYGWRAQYSFDGADGGSVGGTPLAGSGTAQGRACGAVSLSVAVGDSTQSRGFQAVWARCDAFENICHGPECFPSYTPIPASTWTQSTGWDPCAGRCFRAQATHQFTWGDWIVVTDNWTGRTTTGNQTDSFVVCPPAAIGIDIGAAPENGAYRITTACNDCNPVLCQSGMCGEISDGCDGTLNCGDCTSPNTCGGGGVPNWCGCTPATCTNHCGTVNDGCGHTLHCAGCSAGAQCIGNVCVPHLPPPTPCPCGGRRPACRICP